MTGELSSLAIQPGIGLGPFRLGASIGVVLQYVQQHARHLRDNDLLCSPTHPTQTDLTLDLRAIGVRLRFDALQQRLTLIDVYEHTLVPLVYMKSLLVGGSVGNTALATYRSIYGLFGPTFNGSYDAESKAYLLQYPGVCMAFHLPTEPTVDADSDGHGHGQQVIALPDGSSPKLERLFIHCGAYVQQHSSALPPLVSTDTYFEPICIQLGASTTTASFSSQPARTGLYFERRQVHIGFESFAQDLLSDLGAPQNIYIKQAETDKMNIHRQSMQPSSSTSHHHQNSPSIAPRNLQRHSGSPGSVGALLLATSNATAPPPPTSDYFFNYFALGLDVLLDGITHRVKKFILHTNFLDRPDFGQYAKCNFHITAANTGTSSSNAPVAPHGAPDLLELPPTALNTNSAARSMLHLSSAAGVSSPSPSSAASDLTTPSPPQSISIHTGVPDMSTDSSTKSKKAKKKAAAAAATGASSAAESKDASPALAPTSTSAPPPRSPLPSRGAAPPPSSSSLAGILGTTPQSFSPSLSPSVLPTSNATIVTADSKWSDVLAVLGACPSRPMVSSSRVTAGASTAAGDAHSVEPPFAATYFYAYPGAVFEVCKNHHLASVTLFRDE